jgi:hypothetical protein
MQLNEEDIRDFVKVWFAEFNETITDEEARLSASILMNLYLLLADPESGGADDVTTT